MSPLFTSSRVARTATWLVVSLLCLVVAELALRAFAPLHLAGIQSAYEYDADLGYRLRPETRSHETTDHLKEVWVNALGTVNFQESFEAYRTRVFALGDSYTQGTGLSPDSSYPFQLDLDLNRDQTGRYEPRYAVVNLGLAAFGAEQSLLTLQRFANTLGPPNVCLFLGAENDYQDDVLFRSGYRHDQIVSGSPSWGVLSGPLVWASRFELFKRLKITVSQFRRKRVFQSPPVAAGSTEHSSPVAELSWPVIRKIHAACRDFGAPLIVSWSSPGDSYEWMRNQARADGLAFADWWDDVESVQVAVPHVPLKNSHSGGHWRPWVNRIIAETFADEIRELAGEPESTDE